MFKLDGQRMTQPSAQIDVSFEDQAAERVFKALEQSLYPRLWPQRVERTDNPTHYVHVVAASSCRLEFGQELSKNRMEEILTRHKEVFVLTLHLGMRAPPIQFTSPYGDRIKIGQVVYTDRRAPLLELVDDAEGAPLSVCKNKLAAFLQSGGNGGGAEARNRNNSTSNKNHNDRDLEAGRREGEGGESTCKSLISLFFSILCCCPVFSWLSHAFCADSTGASSSFALSLTLPVAWPSPFAFWAPPSSSPTSPLPAFVPSDRPPSPASFAVPVESPYSLLPAPVPSAAACPSPALSPLTVSPFAVPPLADPEAPCPRCVWPRSNASLPPSPVPAREPQETA